MTFDNGSGYLCAGKLRKVCVHNLVHFKDLLHFETPEVELLKKQLPSDVVIYFGNEKVVSQVVKYETEDNWVSVYEDRAIWLLHQLQI